MALTKPTEQQYMDTNLLLQQLKDGKRPAYLYVYKTCFPATDSYINKNSGKTADAEDIFQESLMVLFRALHNKNHKPITNVCGYLFKTAKNLWLDRLRKEKKNVQKLNEFLTTNLPPTFQGITREVLNQTIWTAFKQLSDKCQKILLAKHVYKVPLKEVAEELGYTYSTVRFNSSQCMENLRQLLGEDWKN